MVASVGRCYTNPTDYAQENYYTEGESFANAEWLGKAANIQGLNGQIEEQNFLNAYSCLDPDGNPLRKQQQYQKSSRRNNRPGTDVTLSAPKSVSVAALVYENKDILEAHKAAVRATMKYAENNCIFYQTKQRGQKFLLQSKTAQIAVFYHDDNRNKDPQLHSHCVILNQTVCPDRKWRAVANKELYKQQLTIGAYYDHELARNIQQLGYRVEWTSDHTFELAGVDREKLNAVFSSRSNQIEAELSKLGLTRTTATALQKQAVCLKTRQEKKRSLRPQDRIEQLKEWQSRARLNGIDPNIPTEYHRQEFERTLNSQNHDRSINELISNATEILTEQKNAFNPHELVRECLRQSQGKYDPEKIQTEINSLCEVEVFKVEVQGCRGAEEKLLYSSSPAPHLPSPPASQPTPLRPILIATHDGRLTTTKALSREQKIVQLALSSRDSQIPLSSQERAEAIAQSRSLNTGQSAALKQMVTSRDAVVLIQGNAGVGKTYTMKALKELIDAQKSRGASERRGRGEISGESSSAPLHPCTPASKVSESQHLSQTIRGLAPSAAAASVLQNESGITSQTLASYLLTDNQRLRRQEVILVDEAGMLSTGQMSKLLQKAKSLNNKVILVGDTKQLSAISAGAPFKLLQDAGLSTAIIDQNLRQRSPILKQVVNEIAKSDLDSESINTAYQKLNEQGKIKQIDSDEARIEAIAADYLSRPKLVRNKTLIIAGTNADKQAIAQKVRSCLIAEETLGNKSLNISTLRRLNLDKFAMTQAHHYQRGDVIKFQTDSARFSKNSYYRVTEADPETQAVTLIDTVGLTETLDLDKYKQREVYQLQQLEIRPGERMRFTKNIRSSDYKQLNGQRFTVKGITDDGQIEISSKSKTQNISVARLLHSDYSYVDTVHNSQGQTADYCIYSAANAKSKTIGRESFYVAASRAKQEFVVYTKNAVDLGVTIQLSRKNENAHELVQLNDSPKNQQTRQELDRQQTTKTKSSPTNQLSQLNDVELIDSLNRLSQWQKESPKKPNWNYGQNKHQQIERLKKQEQSQREQLKLQKLELDSLGKPRSILNPFGVSADVIEDKQTEIAQTRSSIYNTQSQIRYVLPDFQRWQKQARAYLAWDESKSTKQMRQLEKDFSAPQIGARVERLKDVYALFAAASYIVNQRGTESSKGRYYQGKSYRIEQQGHKISITHKDRDVLMSAMDNRKRGGIIQASQFNLTREDKKLICDSARRMQQQIERSQKSRQISRGGLSY